MMESRRNVNRQQRLRDMVLLAFLSAVMLVLQFWGSSIRIGATNLSLVLIPIVVGALLLGIKGGLFLGGLFGVTTLLFGGILAMDLFTATLLQQHPLLITLICLLKGIAAGVLPALIHLVFSRRMPFLSVVLASASAPIANTGIFMLGMTTVLGTLGSLVGDVVYFLFFTILVCNFLVEFAANVIAGPAIHRILLAVGKRTGRY